MYHSHMSVKAVKVVMDIALRYFFSPQSLLHILGKSLNKTGGEFFQLDFCDVETLKTKVKIENLEG